MREREESSREGTRASALPGQKALTRQARHQPGTGPGPRPGWPCGCAPLLCASVSPREGLAQDEGC